MALIWDSAGAKCADQVMWCRGLVRSWHSEFQSLLGPGWPWTCLLPPPLLSCPCVLRGWAEPVALEDISAKHLDSQALHSAQVASPSRGLLHELQPQVCVLVPNSATNPWVFLGTQGRGHLGRCWWQQGWGQPRSWGRLLRRGDGERRQTAQRLWLAVGRFPVEASCDEGGRFPLSALFPPFHSLNPFTSYKLRVKATNDIGDSDFSTETEAVTTLQDGKGAGGEAHWGLPRSPGATAGCSPQRLEWKPTAKVFLSTGSWHR